MTDDGPFAWVTSPYTVLAVMTVVIATGLVVVASTSTASFGPFNADWNGASELREEATTVGADPVVLRSTTGYEDLSGDDVAVVLSPEDPYTTAEVERVQRFVDAGGTLVVAEDTGVGGNELLAGVGARARVDGPVLRDERVHYRAPALPVANDVKDRPSTEGVRRLTLNYGTAVRPNGATVLVRTSSYAYLDENGNERPDEAERLRRYPVATVERVGAGRVMVLGDPSLAVNAMVDRGGNRQFFRNVFANAGSVAFDHSHDRLPPLRAASLVLETRPALRVGGALLALGIVAGSLGLDRRRYRRWLSFVTEDNDRDGETLFITEAEITEYLREEHPDWDEGRRRRVAKGVLDGRDNESRRISDE